MQKHIYAEDCIRHCCENTKRIGNYKAEVSSPPPTKRTQHKDYKLRKVLSDLGVYEIYEIFMSYCLDIEEALSSQNLKLVSQLGGELKKELLNFAEGNTPVPAKNEANQIKQLLEEIFILKQKVSELEGPSHFQQISSMRENIDPNLPSEPQEVKKSAHKYPATTGPCPVGRKGKRNLQKWKISKAFVLIGEMREIIYYLISTYWKKISIEMPEQAGYLLSELKSAYAIEIVSHETTPTISHHEQFLERVSLLLDIIDHIQCKGNQQYKTRC